MKNSSNSGNKINQLVIRGLMAEDQEMFINRLSVIIARGREDVLKQLAEGIIVSIKIVDEEAAKNWAKKRYGSGSDEYIINTISVEPSSDGLCAYIRYAYTRTKWFATQEKADRFSRGYSEEGTKEMDETHQFKGVYDSSTSDTTSWDKDWLETEIL